MAIVELGSDGSAVRGAYASVYPCRNLGADLRWGPSGSDTAYKGILNFCWMVRWQWVLKLHAIPKALKFFFKGYWRMEAIFSFVRYILWF